MNLLDPGSLTKKLQSIAKQSFSVKVLSEGFVLVSPHVFPELKLPSKQAVWCRKVELCVDNEVFVQAATYIPLATLQGPGRQLLLLKNRPLGKILFRDPSLKRSPFKISGNTRSSVFYFYGKPLLVQESFTEVCLKKMQGA
ncbi:MAG: chorismate--pyruvate lyase [Gammaproteobacteria bacterium]|jgi:chorismate--pyruvate lyase|nr:chorismate--pyruvate lyase [Gammaproteobacteria bacterium]